MESANAQATGNLIELSEQNLVDCSGPEGNLGCNGGVTDFAFNYTIINGGIDTEDSYPYIGRDEKCKFKKSDVGLVIKNYTDVTHGDEMALFDAVSERVVSVGIEATFELQMYVSGIFSTPCQVPAQINHAVAIVGYGSDNEKDFWIVRNSWGEDWGEQGYVRFAKGQNLCGIADFASYPDV